MTDVGVQGLIPRNETGWRTGLRPLLGAEFGSWWKTNSWWIQALIWTVVINGACAAVIWGEAPDDLELFELYGAMTMFAAIAVAIIMQEAVVGEKRSGTAAWVMSKPASRDAFIASKLVPNSAGVVATMIAIPSCVVWLQLTAAGIDVSVPRFALGASAAALNLLFYLTLTLMLGTLFNTAGPVIAIPLAFAFGQQLLGGVPWVGSLIPWALVGPLGDDGTSVAAAVIGGHSAALGPALFTLGACVVFSVVAFWKWNQTEL